MGVDDKHLMLCYSISRRNTYKFYSSIDYAIPMEKIEIQMNGLGPLSLK